MDDDNTLDTLLDALNANRLGRRTGQVLPSASNSFGTNTCADCWASGGQGCDKHRVANVLAPRALPQGVNISARPQRKVKRA